MLKTQICVTRPQCVKPFKSIETENIELEICNMRVIFWRHMYVAHSEPVWQFGIVLQLGDA